MSGTTPERRADGTAWQPRHGGGADLVKPGEPEPIVTIEPLGPGWWVSAGLAGSDGVNGPLQEAKAQALEMLSGADDRPDRPRHI